MTCNGNCRCLAKDLGSTRNLLWSIITLDFECK